MPPSSPSDIPTEVKTWDDPNVARALCPVLEDIRVKIQQRKDTNLREQVTLAAVKLHKKNWKKWKLLIGNWMALGAVLNIGRAERAKIGQADIELFLHVFYLIGRGESLKASELLDMDPKCGVKRPAPDDDSGCYKRQKTDHSGPSDFPLVSRAVWPSPKKHLPVERRTPIPISMPTSKQRAPPPPPPLREPVPILIPKALPHRPSLKYARAIEKLRFQKTKKESGTPVEPPPLYDVSMASLPVVHDPEQDLVASIPMQQRPPPLQPPKMEDPDASMNLLPGDFILPITPPPTPPNRLAVVRLWRPRDSLPNKLPMPALPPIWAQSRQEVCESTHWFRSYQGGVYFRGGQVMGYLLGGFPSFRDTFLHNGKLIISHGGGKADSVHSEKGKLVRVTDGDQMAQDKSVRALLANYHKRIPLVLIIDDNYACFPFDLASRDVTYAALGVYMISYAWVEYDPSQTNQKGRVARYKFAFQWCQDQGEPWWQCGPFATPQRPMGNEDVEMGSLEQKIEPESDHLTTHPDPNKIQDPPALGYPSPPRSTIADEDTQSPQEDSQSDSSMAMAIDLDHDTQKNSIPESIPMDIYPPPEMLQKLQNSFPPLPPADSALEEREEGEIIEDEEMETRTFQQDAVKDAPTIIEHQSPSVKTEESIGVIPVGSPSIQSILKFQAVDEYDAITHMKEEPVGEDASLGSQRRCPGCKCPSQQVYEPEWTCLQSHCSRFWTTSSGDEFEPEGFHDGFAQLREIASSLTIPSSEVFALPDPNVNEADDPTAAAFTRGWHCRQCGRLSCRSHWDAWRCEHCDNKLDAAMTVRDAQEFRDIPCPVGRAKGDFVIHQSSKIPQPTRKEFDYYCDTTSPARGFITVFELPDNIGKIHRITPDPQDPEPDLIFRDYQSEASTGALKFRRWPMRAHKCRGKLLTNYFSQNSGEPYHYVGGTDNTVPFVDAPEPVKRARDLIVNRVSAALGAKEEFNEILSAAYMEDQKMAFHSDAERGLGPTVAGLSMGSPAVIHFRRLKKKSLQDKHFIELSIVLRHGDILVMDGADVQLQYQHTVVPVNFRIAATARFINPSSHTPVKTEAKPLSP